MTIRITSPAPSTGISVDSAARGSAGWTLSDQPLDRAVRRRDDRAGQARLPDPRRTGDDHRPSLLQSPTTTRDDSVGRGRCATLCSRRGAPRRRPHHRTHAELCAPATHVPRWSVPTTRAGRRSPCWTIPVPNSMICRSRPVSRSSASTRNCAGDLNEPIREISERTWARAAPARPPSRASSKASAACAAASAAAGGCRPSRSPWRRI